MNTEVLRPRRFRACGTCTHADNAQQTLASSAWKMDGVQEVSILINCEDVGGQLMDVNASMTATNYEVDITGSYLERSVQCPGKAFRS